MEGYFKVYRKITESQVFAHQTALKIWIWCLAKASYRERYVNLKSGKGEISVKIKAGEFLFGRFRAEEELSIDGSTIYKWIQRFASKEYSMITIKSNNQYSIISICNWEDYQQDISDSVATKEQPMSNQVTAKEQPSNTNKKDKNIKESIEDRSKKFTPPSVEEISAFILEKNYKIDAEYFHAHYTSNGWKVGKSSMKDWHAAVVTWVKRDKEKQKATNPQKKSRLHDSDFN